MNAPLLEIPVKHFLFSLLLVITSFACSNDQSEPAEIDAGSPSNGEPSDAMTMSMNSNNDAANMGADATPLSDAGPLPIQDAQGMNNADMGPMDSPEDCRGLCEYLEMCNSCFYDPEGECLDVEGCISVCTNQTSATVAQCIAGLEACDEDSYQGCYDADIGNDDCAQTCRFLEECEECFLDESGECLSLASCAVICRDTTPPAAAACIANLSDCGGITACYQQ